MLGRLGKTALAAAASAATRCSSSPFGSSVAGRSPRSGAFDRAYIGWASQQSPARACAVSCAWVSWSVGLLSLPLIGVLLLTAAHSHRAGPTAGSRHTRGVRSRAPLCLGAALLARLFIRCCAMFAMTALGRPRVALYVMAVAIMFNFVGDYALIFGNFGMPKLGCRPVRASQVLHAPMRSSSSRCEPSCPYLKLKLHRVFRRFHRRIGRSWPKCFASACPSA